MHLICTGDRGTGMKLKLSATMFMVSSVLLAGCMSTYEPIKVMPSNGERGVPADYAKFASILGASKLQISTPNAKEGSKNEVATDSNFTGVMDENFYVDKGSEALVFKMQGYKLRNELRILENFKTDNPYKIYKLSADLMLIDPMNAIKNSDPERDEMTFLQVHNKGTHDDGKHGAGYIPHPLVRIVWEGERRGIHNHYWAIVKNNAVNCSKEFGNREKTICKKAYTRYDLGEHDPVNPVHFDITVGDQRLIIDFNGDNVVDHKLDYWKHMRSYFKAGVYNQFEKGQSEAHFYNLQYSVEETKF